MAAANDERVAGDRKRAATGECSVSRQRSSPVCLARKPTDPPPRGTSQCQTNHLVVQKSVVIVVQPLKRVLESSCIQVLPGGWGKGYTSSRESRQRTAVWRPVQHKRRGFLRERKIVCYFLLPLSRGELPYTPPNPFANNFLSKSDTAFKKRFGRGHPRRAHHTPLPTVAHRLPQLQDV